MNAPHKAKLRRQHAQSYRLTKTNGNSANRNNVANRNAVKHGMRSTRLLLAGDERGEFDQRRRDAYTEHRPGTATEARCVDKIVRLEWRIERCERWQEIYDAKHDAVVDTDHGTGPHCEADPHRWMHRAMDCVRQAQRMEWQMARAHRRLELLQKMRRHKLLSRVAALEAEDVEVPEEEVEPAVEAAAMPEEAAIAATPATGSGHGRNGNGGKRNGEYIPGHIKEARPLGEIGESPGGSGAEMSP